MVLPDDQRGLSAHRRPVYQGCGRLGFDRLPFTGHAASGAIDSPSTILRKLGTASRENNLYSAFRELGRVVRTIFLLEYISNDELRRIIQAAQNNHLIANLLIFHNYHTITQALKELEAEGMQLTPELIAAFSPYRRHPCQSLWHV
jgi:TnpA family transposase